jgi:DNA-binding transcriptional ArsR family regulator
MSGLTERLRAMLAETADERSGLETRRSELAAERDAKLDEVRREYGERIAVIDAELATVKRIERALDPPERVKRDSGENGAKTPAKPSRALSWRPKDDAMREVLLAIDGGASTVSEITAAVSVSRGTVDSAIAWLREDGLVRLAGTVKPGNGHGEARAYRLTPQGTIEATRRDGEATEALSNGAHA